ncbi:MAG: AMP-binding protein [Cyanobacteria bacterium P01_B01_bin.77]
MANRLAYTEPLQTTSQNSLSTLETLVDVLQWRALHQSEQTACQFLPIDASNITQAAQANRLTYADLDQQARYIGARLRTYLAPQSVSQQRRILLAYSAGLEFVAALFGCWYAGAIAVPVQPARRHQGGTRWQHILRDAQAEGILTSQNLLPEVEQVIASQANSKLFCLATDGLAKQSNQPEIQETQASQTVSDSAPALLQYTSGSTSHPKGVMVSHGNLMHNLAVIYQNFGHSPDSHGVIWLPPHHDMGLIGGILQPIYGGFPVTLMPPESFLRKPLRWLQAISVFQATTSGGPDFAYDYCLHRITTAQRQQLDLSSWRLAFTGAEPVRAKTLADFSATFASCGFKARAFYPCYGLAEATLFVSGGHQDTPARIRSLSRQDLSQGNVVEMPSVYEQAISIVSCGDVCEHTDLIIVDPDSKQSCSTEQVGEIWVSGDSVTQGYWQNSDATQESFHAYLPDGRGPYLRTGDLGFYDGHSLYVTGRLKDLIVIRGQNHYPQDIEQTVAQSHTDLTLYGAAFSLDIQGEESLVVFQEVTREAVRKLDTETVVRAIRAAVSQHHGLQVSAIWLLKPGHLPKTTSGKVQRQACKVLFQEKTLATLEKWSSAQEAQEYKNLESKESSLNEVESRAKLSSPSPTNNKTLQSLLTWLRQYTNESINSRLMDERRCISPGVILDFGNQGLLGMQVPQQYGGLGLDNQSMLRVLEQLGAIDPTLALFVGLNNVLGVRPILRYAQPELREQLLPQLAAGRELAAFALTEPGAGSHPFGMMSKATPTNDGWHLDGQKIWSGSAAWAGIINVFVKQYDASGNPMGVSSFAVQKGSPGLRQGPEALTMGMRAMVQNTVFLDNVSVDSSQLLGEPGAGMVVAQDAMMYGRLTIAAASVGGMKRCAQLMLHYSSRRSISTGPLLNNPVTLTRLNWLTHAIATLHGLVTFIAQRLDQDLSVPEELYAACKILGPELYWQAADNLVQCLGGRGYIETNIAPQILRDARVLRIFEGPTESLAMYLGARMLNQPASLKDFLTELNLEPLAGSLVAATDEILAYYQGPQSPFSDDVVARQQANFVAGQATAWGLAIAALKSLPTDSAQVTSSNIEWAQHYFDQTVAQIANPNNTSTATTLREQISHYYNNIGELEQTHSGADEKLDEWLRADSPEQPISKQTEALLTDICQAKSDISSKSLLKQKKVIEQWLIQWLAQHLRIATAQIDLKKALADYGVDSVMAVELAQDLEDFLTLSQPLDATLAWNFPTISTLSKHLAELSTHSPKVEDIQKPSVDVPAEEETDLDNLSEAEMADMLAAELAMVRRR